MEIKLKIGDYVLINKSTKNLVGYAKFAQENNLPLLVYAIQSITCNVYTNQLHINNFAQNPFVISTNELILLTLEQVNKMVKKLNGKYEKEAKQRLKILNTKRISLGGRKDYSIATRQFLDTRGNFLVLYSNGNIAKNNYDVSTTKGKAVQTYGVVCCSFSRTNNDIVAYIPKSWLKYFGYNLADVKAWLKFLNGCEIGYEGRVTGTSTLKKVFGIRANNVMNIKTATQNHYYNIDEECIEVFVNGSNITMHTYLRFICTRFIYSNKYWNIPAIAMKLKKNIPSLTNWECLLLAHCNENYDGYYSLTDNVDFNLAIPSAYNSAENILSVLENTSGMNRAFRKYKVDNLRTAMHTEDWKTIEEIVEKYRKIS